MAKRVYESRIADNVNNFANEEIKINNNNNNEETHQEEVHENTFVIKENTQPKKIPDDFTLNIAKKQTKILRSFNLEIEIYERLLKFIDDNQLKINAYINALISNDLKNRGY